LVRPDSRDWTVDVLSRPDDVERIVEDWDELARAGSGAPFTLPAVALAWWEHLGRGRLRVTTVRDGDGRLRAVAPLHARPLGPGRALRWLGTGLGSVCEVVGDDEAAAAVWSTIRRDVLDLYEYPVGGTGYSALVTDASRPVHRRPMESCPVIDLDGLDGLDALLAGRKNLRKTLARADRAVEATGEPFEVEVVTAGVRLAEVLPEIESVFDAAEAARPRQHLLRAPWRDFTVAALGAAARRNQLAVFIARLGTRAVACDIDIVVGRRLGVWYGRFDPSVAELSPGHLLLRRQVRWALDHRLATVDLLVGEHEYKLRWATSSYPTVHVVGGSRLALALGRPALAARDRLHHALRPPT
jgi:CelD/BcsL family acetyltransferase involved in cellulose biosynthesis